KVGDATGRVVRRLYFRKLTPHRRSQVEQALATLLPFNTSQTVQRPYSLVLRNDPQRAVLGDHAGDWPLSHENLAPRHRTAGDSDREYPRRLQSIQCGQAALPKPTVIEHGIVNVEEYGLQ